MPKPQRKQKQEIKSAETSTNETTHLVQEVKRIKLNRVNNYEPMDCGAEKVNSCERNLKRSISETVSDNKRKRIQWP